MSTAQFERLLSPGRIGTMELSNRILLAPMGTGLAEKGFVSRRTIAYYEARAKGGAGAVIVENATVDSNTGRWFEHSLTIDDDKYIPGMSELAAAIKRHAASPVLQLYNGTLKLQPGQRPVFAFRLSPHMAVEEIHSLVACFARGARRAKDAGFEGLEIHAAHYNTVSQFLSASWNKRQDEYGGSPAKRVRFLLDILAAIRAQVGKEFPVWARISAVELGLEGGRTIEETLEQAPMIVAAGSDAIHVSIAGFVDFVPKNYVMCSEQPGCLLPFAEAIKRVTSVPVIVANRIDPQLAEKALQEGKADFIAMGRTLFTDPELPKKLASGRADEVRPCIACNHCIEAPRFNDGVKCTVNPALSREREYVLTRATKSKKIVIAGGGPGGMEAARVAALRGHQVTLYEKGQTLGRQLILAAIPPHKERIRPYTDYLTNQMKKLNVRVKLSCSLTPEEVDIVKPDVVILATGSKAVIPNIPGLEYANAVIAEDVLLGRTNVGDQVIVIGGELVGCETALFLAEKGKKVTITRRGTLMAGKMLPGSRTLLLQRLEQNGVRMITGVTYVQASDGGLAISSRNGQDLAFIEADTIVIAAGFAPNTDLLAALKGKVPETYCIGDCVAPRGIVEAVNEGHDIARKL